jgi:hypothetical protein
MNPQQPRLSGEKIKMVSEQFSPIIVSIVPSSKQQKIIKIFSL